MDKLDKMCEIQRNQQKAFNMDPESASPMMKAQMVKDLMLGLYEEVTELSGVSSNFKAHILKSPPILKTNVADAAADVIKYAIAIAQIYGITSDGLCEAFDRKSRVVDDRAKGEKLALERNTKVIVVDVDNVIADLSVWQATLKEALGDAPIRNTVVTAIESLKDEFYRDGGFLHIPPMDGAADGLRELKQAGWTIVLVSARPYWQYKRVYGDTLDWLRKHEMTYDLILFNKDKAEAIYENIFPAKPAYLIEDREKHAKEVVEIGVSVLLVDWDYNKDVEDGDMIKRVKSWKEIVKAIGQA